MESCQYANAAKISADAAPGTRVNVIGIVVNVNQGQPQTFVIDDKSGLMLARRFDNAPAPKLGSCINLVGSIREFEGERYVAAEIVKAIPPLWLEVRLLQLAQKNADIKPPEEPAHIDKRAELLSMIRTLDKGSGAQIDDIVSKAGKEAEAIIALMLEQGDIFEPSPGVLKILE